MQKLYDKQNTKTLNKSRIRNRAMESQNGAWNKMKNQNYCIQFSLKFWYFVHHEIWGH